MLRGTPAFVSSITALSTTIPIICNQIILRFKKWEEAKRIQWCPFVALCYKGTSS